MPAVKKNQYMDGGNLSPQREDKCLKGLLSRPQRPRSARPMASIPCVQAAYSIRAVNRLSEGGSSLSDARHTPLLSSFCPSIAAIRRSSKRAPRGSPSHSRWNVMAAQVEKDGDLIMEDDSGVNALLDPSNPALKEKFIVIDTGRHECQSCGYVYNQSGGDPSYPISAGTPFKQLPEDWRCPTCGAAANLFLNKAKEIAGFAQNQSYGLGGNSLTSGQKSILIYGSLVFFFALFLSGYFLS